VNKSQGVTASAIILTGVLLRPSPLSVSSQIPNQPVSRVASNAAVVSVKSDGPWKASCNYWKPGQSVGDSENDRPLPSRDGSGLSISVTERGTTFVSHITGSKQEEDTHCNSQEWGIPQSTSGLTPHLTVIIATVPDPVHSSMALEFDRSIDVLTQAAADNEYIESYFWLPWKHALDTPKSAQSVSEAEAKEDLDRESQPGLLILKKSTSIPRLILPENAKLSSSRNNPRVPPASPRGTGHRGSRQPLFHPHPPGDDNVIYLFLVGQTPAIGVNGEQLRNALQDAVYLREQYGADLSLKHPDDQADIIGPNNSGAAASLRAGLESSRLLDKISKISIAGITSTKEAASALNGGERIKYISFGDDSQFEQSSIIDLFRISNHRVSNIAFLLENGTVFGEVTARKIKEGGPNDPIVIRFPREISLLRNAENGDKTPPPEASPVANNPYLHLSLKDSSVEDTIPHFSPDLTPFSQEAQWMAIVRELKRRRVEVVAISASNILDELFLAKSVHRDLPDVRAVFFAGSDLMFVRYSDNASYLGSIAFTAYPFDALSQSRSSKIIHNFANAWTEALYNAASYTFWNDQDLKTLHLADYQTSPTGQSRHIPLWATTVGRDGYYPLGIVNECASGSESILPTVELPEPLGCSEPATSAGERYFKFADPIFPSFSWYFLCIAIAVLCLAHSFVFGAANFWSPRTRDLAIEHSDQPRRRAVYIHIATAMLFSMSFIAAFPILPTRHLIQRNPTTLIFTAATLAIGVLAVYATLRRTLRYIVAGPVEETGRRDSPCRKPLDPREKDNVSSETVFYPWFNLIALLTALAVPLLWAYLCTNDRIEIKGTQHSTLVGFFFSYRCLYPASGVSPILPILFLLFSWYLWAFFQTRRLRFSENSRPMLPKHIDLGTPVPLYVSDDALGSCSRSVDSCLYENISCLLITRQVLHRLLPHRGSRINLVLALIYAVLFATFVFGLPVQSLDRFLRGENFHLTPYEFLISALFYPLLVVALTGTLRLLLVWAALNQGLLEPLERSPLRFAFSRLTSVAWITMLRQGGLLEYWRDMTRSNEAIQQLTHNNDLIVAAKSRDSKWDAALNANHSLKQHIDALLKIVNVTTPARRRKEDRPQPWDACGNFLFGGDLPFAENRGELNLMCAIECGYATFAERLLADILVPYWSEQRSTLVEADLPPSTHTNNEKNEGGNSADQAVRTAWEDPTYIRLAEEFLVIRYVSLIRAVLINIRQLMTFVSSAFVLAIIAFNSYPFEPRQWVDWAFTGLLFALGASVVLVFAQMHRNPILSRITGTQVNQLGSAFYIRLATFGAVPVLTWLASQFPTIGNGISRLIQSGLQVAK
jgi:hypothetical protein